MDKTRIILVEDDAISSLLLEKQLNYLGYEVIGKFASAEDTAVFLENNQPDLILMDIFLSSDINGIEATKSLREKYSVPVIFITGHSDYETFSEAKECNACGYLIKPVNARDLHITIELALQKKKESIETKNQLLDVMTRDSLTGLYNKCYIEQQIELQNNDVNLSKISVITSDINGLNDVNVSYCYAKGNFLIKAVASIIIDCVSCKNLAARISSGTFMIIIYDSDRHAVNEMVEVLIRRSNKVLNGFGASLSIGSAVENSSVQGIRELITRSEKRMNLNKLNNSNSIHNAIVKVLLRVLGEKTHETEEHCLRLKELAISLGEALNLPTHELDKLSLLALLHDIGKATVDDRILTKQSKLNSSESSLMKKHAEIGARILENSPELSEISNLVMCHHEKWDGSGYPKGLKGEQIPLLSRIIAVIDAYDAMTNKRCYKEAIPHETAMVEILNCAGTHFDPIIAKAFSGMPFDEQVKSTYLEAKKIYYLQAK